MTTVYRARLQFAPGGPQVFGEWTVEGTAENIYLHWIGVYPVRPGLLIQLTEQIDDGPGIALRTWPPAAEGVA